MLGAGKAGAFFASTAAGSGEAGSSGGGGEDTELGAGAGEEWSGVQIVGDGGRYGEIGRERVDNGVGEAAGVVHGGDQDEKGEGAEGGRDGVRRQYRRLSAILPCNVFLPPSLSA